MDSRVHAILSSLWPAARRPLAPFLVLGVDILDALDLASCEEASPPRPGSQSPVWLKKLTATESSESFRAPSRQVLHRSLWKVFSGGTVWGYRAGRGSQKVFGEKEDGSRECQHLFDGECGTQLDFSKSRKAMDQALGATGAPPGFVLAQEHRSLAKLATARGVPSDTSEPRMFHSAAAVIAGAAIDLLDRQYRDRFGGTWRVHCALNSNRFAARVCDPRRIVNGVLSREGPWVNVPSALSNAIFAKERKHDVPLWPMMHAAFFEDVEMPAVLLEDRSRRAIGRV
ncbi:unnamed protein product [Symbiodinium sp. CCMP2592]|nr:unnamed protein product [Symbiodinium sp. CCMP2592]